MYICAFQGQSIDKVDIGDESFPSDTQEIQNITNRNEDRTVKDPSAKSLVRMQFYLNFSYPFSIKANVLILLPGTKRGISFTGTVWEQ